MTRIYKIVKANGNVEIMFANPNTFFLKEKCKHLPDDLEIALLSRFNNKLKMSAEEIEFLKVNFPGKLLNLYYEILTETDYKTIEQNILDLSGLASYSEITIDDVPSDRTYRNAWRENAGKIEVDLNEAKQIKLNEIRELRNKQLAALDYEYIKADEASSVAQKSIIAAKKQSLRDLPATEKFAGVTTPEQLKDYIPVELRQV